MKKRSKSKQIPPAQISSPATSAPTDQARDWPVMVRVLVLAVFAYLVFINLGYAPFWDDEAVMGFIAHNTLEFGLLLADDGRNVFSYRDSADDAEDLTFRYPKLIIYL